MNIEQIRESLLVWNAATDALHRGDMSQRNTKYGLEEQLEPVLKALPAADVATLKADAECGPCLARICASLGLKLEADASAATIPLDPAELLCQWHRLEFDLRSRRHRPFSSGQSRDQFIADSERLSALAEALSSKLREMWEDGVLAEFERQCGLGRVGYVALDDDGEPSYDVVIDRGKLYQIAEAVGCSEIFAPERVEGIEPAFERYLQMQKRVRVARSLQTLNTLDCEDEEVRDAEMADWAEEHDSDGQWALRAYKVHWAQSEGSDEDRFVRAITAVETAALSSLNHARIGVRTAILQDVPAYEALLSELNAELRDGDDTTAEYARAKARRDAYRMFVRDYVPELDKPLERERVSRWADDEPQPQAQVKVATKTATETDLDVEAEVERLLSELGWN
jgi:hypothetical protein